MLYIYSYKTHVTCIWKSSKYRRSQCWTVHRSKVHLECNESHAQLHSRYTKSTDKINSWISELQYDHYMAPDNKIKKRAYKPPKSNRKFEERSWTSTLVLIKWLISSQCTLINRHSCCYTQLIKFLRCCILYKGTFWHLKYTLGILRQVNGFNYIRCTKNRFSLQNVQRLCSISIW